MFGEVDNAIRDKNYRIEFEEEQGKSRKKKTGGKSSKLNKIVRKKKDGKKPEAPVVAVSPEATAAEESVSPDIAFVTAFDQPEGEEQPDVQETDDHENIGEMVDINALFERSSDSLSSAPEKSEAEPEKTAEEPSSESTENKQ